MLKKHRGNEKQQSKPDHQPPRIDQDVEDNLRHMLRLEIKVQHLIKAVQHLTAFMQSVSELNPDLRAARTHLHHLTKEDNPSVEEFVNRTIHSP